MTTFVACRKAVDILHIVAEMRGSDSERLSSLTLLQYTEYRCTASYSPHYELSSRTYICQKEKQITMSEEAPACRSAPGERARAMGYIEEVQVSPFLCLAADTLDVGSICLSAMWNC